MLFTSKLCWRFFVHFVSAHIQFAASKCQQLKENNLLFWKLKIVVSMLFFTFYFHSLHKIWIVQLQMDLSQNDSLGLSFTVCLDFPSVIHNYVHVALNMIYLTMQTFLWCGTSFHFLVCLLFLCFMHGSFHCSFSTWHMDNAWQQAQYFARRYVIKTNFSKAFWSGVCVRWKEKDRYRDSEEST